MTTVAFSKVLLNYLFLCMDSIDYELVHTMILALESEYSKSESGFSEYLLLIHYFRWFKLVNSLFSRHEEVTSIHHHRPTTLAVCASTVGSAMCHF